MIHTTEHDIMDDTDKNINSNGNDEEKINNPWTEYERSKLEDRSKRQCMYDKYTRTFNSAFTLKLKESVFGSYLDIFNSQQNSDKDFIHLKLDITMFDMRNFTEKDIDRFQRNNDFIDGGYEYLKNIIHEEKPVSFDYLRNDMKSLKLNSFYVSFSEIYE